MLYNEATSLENNHNPNSWVALRLHHAFVLNL